MSKANAERAVDRTLIEEVVSDFEALALRIGEAIDRLPLEAHADRQRLERARANAERGAALARSMLTQRT